MGQSELIYDERDGGDKYIVRLLWPIIEVPRAWQWLKAHIKTSLIVVTIMLSFATRNLLAWICNQDCSWANWWNPLKSYFGMSALLFAIGTTLIILSLKITRLLQIIFTYVAIALMMWAICWGIILVASFLM